MDSFFTNAKIVGENYDPEKYHSENGKRGSSDYVIGRSSLLEFNRCPHRWLVGYENDETKSTEFGSALDCLLLTPQRFDTSYAICPETYQDDKSGKDKPWTFAATVCKEWRDQHKGKKVLKADVMSEIEAATKSAKRDDIIGSVLECSAKQVYIIGDYVDSTTGITIKCKTLLDAVPNFDSPWKGSLWDLKSARNASPSAWPRVVFDHGYDVQAAMSLDLYNAAKPTEERTDFCHAIVENFPPFETGKRILSQEFIMRGRFVYQTALARYAGCLADNEWPGYEDGQREVLMGMTLVQPEQWMMNP